MLANPREKNNRPLHASLGKDQPIDCERCLVHPGNTPMSMDGCWPNLVTRTYQLTAHCNGQALATDR